MFLQRDTIEEVIRSIQARMDQVNAERVTDLPQEEQVRLIEELKQALKKANSSGS